MANENEFDDKIEDVESVHDVTPVLGDDGVTDMTDWKAEAMRLKDIADKNAGIAKRNKTRAEKARATKADPAPKKDAEPKLGEFDYGQKAFLVANGIKGEAETKLVSDIVKATGQNIDAVLASPHFQGELKGIREVAAAKAAMPDGTNRPSNSAVDTVDYWIKKGELPPKEQVDLRQKVVNARIKNETAVNVFSSDPVVK